MIVLLVFALCQQPAASAPPPPPAPAAASENSDRAPPPFESDDVVRAGKVAGFVWTPEQVALMQSTVLENFESAQTLWKQSLSNDVPPAFVFDALLPGMQIAPPKVQLVADSLPEMKRPANLEDLSFASIRELAALVKSKQVSCVELTQMSLARLKKLDPKLLCVVNLTEERALAQAKSLDDEIAHGHWRGLLHGIPWGAKDLIAARGTKTTWGSPIFEDQVLDIDATVVEKLDAAGAVLVAKLSLGELAYGDLWFGGRTRNPWDLEHGSSGSSAGPASATVAGCVVFGIGSETLGSIMSPSSRCGASGLRPTFGAVSRHGAMALSWTMDKLGPLCRSAEDCAIVFDAIRGPDGHDPCALRSTPFTLGNASAASAAPDGAKGLAALKVGFPKGAFDKRTHAHVLDELKKLGVEPFAIDLPARVNASDLLLILVCEAATAFDEVTRSGADAKMVWQDKEAWPNTFRAARLIPAVEYLRAMRLRTQLMRDMDQVMSHVDVFVSPTEGSQGLVITNLTGHPSIAMPDGFDGRGRPSSIMFTGRLYGEQDLLSLARAWQESTSYHRAHPKLD